MSMRGQLTVTNSINLLENFKADMVGVYQKLQTVLELQKPDEVMKTVLYEEIKKSKETLDKYFSNEN